MLKNKMKGYFVLFLIGYFQSIVKAEVRCPTAVRILPCQCSEDPFGGGDTSQLRCYRRNVEDETISDILDVFLTTPLLSPLTRLDTFNKRLTKIPEQLTRFPRLDSVQLHENDIHHISSGAFNFRADMFILNLRYNQLTTIEPGAFQGNYGRNGSALWLDNNNLTLFESGVFQPVLEQMAVFGYPNAHVDISNNPIECNCHLAWLIQDNRNLLTAVNGGQCSDGRRFDQLDPDTICDEPTTTSTTVFHTGKTTVSIATSPPTETVPTTTTSLTITTPTTSGNAHTSSLMISYGTTVFITGCIIFQLPSSYLNV